MHTLSIIALSFAAGLVPCGQAPHEFVHVKGPLVPSKRAAPSAKVSNGTVFESGAIELPVGSTLTLPANAVVEKYDGSTVRFFLTKTLRCMGHPPTVMKFDVARKHFGIARRVEQKAVVVSTFGEWGNRGGTAAIQLLVLVPRATEYTQGGKLHGQTSRASAAFRVDDKALLHCYWYAAPRPKDGWSEIATDLHFSRFLQPR